MYRQGVTSTKLDGENGKPMGKCVRVVDIQTGEALKMAQDSMLLK